MSDYRGDVTIPRNVTEYPTLLSCYANNGETWRSVDSEKFPSQAAGDSVCHGASRPFIPIEGLLPSDGPARDNVSLNE
jgi:hypothetical protein